MERLRLSQEQWRTMQQHAAEQAPLEACGLLAGKDGRVQEVILIRNRAQSPTRFIMDPVEQINAFQRIDESGMELLGIFHSHPRGPEGMSPTDIQEAAYEVVQVIWSPQRGKWAGQAFRLEEGKPCEVKLDII